MSLSAAVNMNNTTRTLHLKLTSAKNIHVSGFSKKNVRLVASISGGDLLNTQTATTNILHLEGGTSPAGNQFVSLHFDDSLANQNRLSLKLKLVSKVPILGSDTVIGTGVIPFMELLVNPAGEVSCPVMTSSMMARGILNLAYKFDNQVEHPPGSPWYIPPPADYLVPAGPATGYSVQQSNPPAGLAAGYSVPGGPAAGYPHQQSYPPVGYPVPVVPSGYPVPAAGYSVPGGPAAGYPHQQSYPPAGYPVPAAGYSVPGGPAAGYPVPAAGYSVPGGPAAGYPHQQSYPPAPVGYPVPVGHGAGYPVPAGPAAGYPHQQMLGGALNGMMAFNSMSAAFGNVFDENAGGFDFNL